MRVHHAKQMGRGDRYGIGYAMGKEIRMQINMGMEMEMEMAEGKKKREIHGTAAARCCFGHSKHTSPNTTSHREDPGQQRPSCGHKLHNTEP